MLGGHFGYLSLGQHIFWLGHGLVWVHMGPYGPVNRSLRNLDLWIFAHLAHVAADGAQMIEGPYVPHGAREP